VMANDEHLALLRKGVALWNEWRARNPHEKPDLSEASLSRASLSGANLRAADLRQANLLAADLRKADLSGADLDDAYLREADSAARSLGKHPCITRIWYRRSSLGHEERFPPTRLSAGCGFRKETIAGMRRNGRDAPIPAVQRQSGNLFGTRGGRHHRRRPRIACRRLTLITRERAFFSPSVS
jgi:hypothetical protein